MFPSNYYEAIIQIRHKNQEVLNFVKTETKKRKDLLIIRESEFKYGLDLYLTSQRFARALGKKLKKRFDGELKLTRTLHTFDRKTSKKVYRVTISFRLKLPIFSPQSL